MFIDASAIVAILSSQHERETFAALIERETARRTSAVALLETGLALMRAHGMNATEANQTLLRFVQDGRIAAEPLMADIAWVALLAHERFGNGRGHPARLNIGDCLADAAAKAANVPLLFAGEDFARTDIQPALVG